MSSAPGLHVADYVVFAAMLLVSLGIGVYYSLSGGRQRTTEEYLMGNRQMSVLPVTLSYTVSFISTILLLGYPAEIYSFGAEIAMGTLGVSLGNLLAVFLFVPVLYPLKYTSINEYLLRRFDSHLIKAIGSICTLGGAILYSASVYFGPSTAIEAVSGFPAWISIVITSVVSVFYTTIGGFKAVVWTDVFQCVIMYIGLIALLIKGAITAGGMGIVFETSKEWGRLKFFEWDLDPTRRVTTWNVVIGRMMLFLAVCGVGQPSFQRYCSMPTRSQANKVVLGGIPGMFVLSILAYLLGWVVFTHYTLLGCDPLASGQLTNPNQVVPLFVTEVFNIPGAPGLFLAACTAASLSSASSALNAASAIAWEDILKPFVFKKATPNQAATIAKILVVFFGMIGTGLGIMLISVGGTVVQIMGTFSAGFDGTFLALFLIGIFLPFVNWKGLVCGSILGVVFGFWVSIGSYSIKKHLEVLPAPTTNCSSSFSPLDNSTVGPGAWSTLASVTPVTSVLGESGGNVYGIPSWEYNLYSLSFLWIMPVVAAIVTFVSIFASLAFGGLSDAKTVDAALLHPWIRRWCGTKKVAPREVASSNSSEAVSKADSMVDQSAVTSV